MDPVNYIAFTPQPDGSVILSRVLKGRVVEAHRYKGRQVELAITLACKSLIRKNTRKNTRKKDTH